MCMYIRYFGFNDIWISQDVVDEDKFLCEFKQRVIDCFVSEAVAFFEDSPKCNFYMLSKSFLNLILQMS
jgi:hypothetical protein